MKRIVILYFLLIPAMLLLSLSASAEPSEVLSGIFNTLTAADSEYSRMKETYAEYFPETRFEETLADDSFTITISGNEYMDGSWTFVQDGDYLTLTKPSDDMYSAMFIIYVLDAVAEYYDMPVHLVNSYITGLNANGIKTDYFTMTEDKETQTTTYGIYAAGPYDMKELDQMILNDAVLDYEPLNEDFISMGSSAGKMMMVANGSVNDITILIGEYGRLDDLAYQSAINVVKKLQPKGWETFVSDYKELVSVETSGYSVDLTPDEETVREIVSDLWKNENYMIIRFGE